jgi:hypothetical protein
MNSAIMPTDHSLDSELVEQITRTTGLSAADASRVVADVMAYLASDTAEDYVRRRHRELQLRGVRNDAIFARVGEELRRRPVRAPELSARQLRRIVYG